ncbi:MAG: hypothetical protein ABJF88_14355 [Rhodothermales bacterium]
MDSVDTLLKHALDALASKEGYAKRKQAYSQEMSAAIASAFSEAVRQRGMREALPAPPGSDGPSGSERRMAGGIGAKKVDVTWATEECGLIFSISVKTINWRDARSGNFQKNLTNRRGDLLFEAVTLHRRFPYAVVLGFLFLDVGALRDGTDLRNSTFHNAHQRLKLFTGRDDPGDREEQFERLYIVLVDADPQGSQATCYHVGDPAEPVSFEQAFHEAIVRVAERNPDFYEVDDGRITRL